MSFSIDQKIAKGLFAHYVAKCQVFFKKSGGKWGDVVHYLIKWGE